MCREPGGQRSELDLKQFADALRDLPVKRSLVLTNHHVASSIIAKLSTKERDLMKTGYYAKTPADELKMIFFTPR